MMTMHKNQFDVAEGHCQRCLTYSRRIGVEGEEKTTLVFSALRAYVDLRQRQGNFSGVAGAVIFAEKAYNFIVDVYDPVHPQVQAAASTLVNCLVAEGNLYDAQRYAEQTYANLKDLKNGIDQESEVVATGSLSLANVILRQDDGDLNKAEELARESLRVRTKLYDPQHFRVGECCQCLGSILQKQRKMGDETRDFFERSLAICTRNEGPDGRNTAESTVRIGQFYYQLAILQSTVISKRSHLKLAKSYFKEAIHIGTKVMKPTNSCLVGAKSCLSGVMSELSRV
jgi:ATP/maltotriose-dependent transcriptional regulator MalT